MAKPVGWRIEQSIASETLFGSEIRKALRGVNIETTGLFDNRVAQAPINILASLVVGVTATLEFALNLIETLSMFLAAPFASHMGRYKELPYRDGLDQMISVLADSFIRMFAPLVMLSGLFGKPLRIVKPEEEIPEQPPIRDEPPPPGRAGDIVPLPVGDALGGRGTRTSSSSGLRGTRDGGNGKPHGGSAPARSGIPSGGWSAASRSRTPARSRPAGSGGALSDLSGPRQTDGPVVGEGDLNGRVVSSRPSTGHSPPRVGGERHLTPPRRRQPERLTWDDLKLPDALFRADAFGTLHYYNYPGGGVDPGTRRRLDRCQIPSFPVYDAKVQGEGKPQAVHRFDAIPYLTTTYQEIINHAEETIPLPAGASFMEIGYISVVKPLAATGLHPGPYINANVRFTVSFFDTNGHKMGDPQLIWSAFKFFYD